MITFAVEIGNNGSCWKPKIYDTAQVLAQPFPVYIDIRPQGVSDENLENLVISQNFTS